MTTQVDTFFDMEAKSITTRFYFREEKPHFLHHIVVCSKIIGPQIMSRIMNRLALSYHEDTNSTGYVFIVQNI